MSEIVDQMEHQGDLDVSAAESQVVIGFTEAELGLVIGVLFMALWFASPKDNATEKSRMISADSVHVLDSIISAQRARISVLEARDSTGNASNIQGTCQWRGITKGMIGPIRVLGSEGFEHDGKEYSWPQLATLFAKEIKQARDAKCTHQILGQVSAQLPTGEYLEARAQVGRYFYLVARRD